MICSYITENGYLVPCDNDVEDDVWVRLVDPTPEEIDDVSRRFDVDSDTLEDPLDSEAISHVEVTGEGTLHVIVDVPVRTIRNGGDAFMTLPLSVIISKKAIITSCLQKTGTLDAIVAAASKKDDDAAEKGVSHAAQYAAFGTIDTRKKLRFVYQILLSAAQRYQETLLSIDAERRTMEKNLSSRAQDSELIKLHSLEVDLIYYETSLSADQTVVERILGSDKIEHYPEDRDLLQDVVLETKQAKEMATTYHEILSGTRELFASVLDNRLNRVMKILTGLTIILSIPMIIAGFYGMNVSSGGMPLANFPFAFGLIALITLVICILIAILLHKKDLL